MIGRALLGITAVAFVLAGCGYVESAPAPRVAPANEQDPSAGFLAGVVSACDEHGNRVYTRPTSGTIAVVGQDPTCSAVASGSGNGGLEEGVAPADLEGAVTG